MPERATNTLLGGLVGDALGRPFEGTPRGELAPLRDALARRIAEPRAWGHSDDGEVLLGHALSLVECGRLDEQHLLTTLADRCEPARGYGKGMRAAFRYLRETGEWEDAAFALWPEGSDGNGGAVRVAPIALLHRATSLDVVVADARRSARPTHGHPVAIEGAVVIAAAVHASLCGVEPRTCVELAIAHAETLGSRLAMACALVESTPIAVIDVLGHGVAARESVPAALWAWVGARSFEEAVTRAIELGGDTDSIAAITGTLAGAQGWAIPAAWIAALEPIAVREARSLGAALERLGR